MNILDNVLRYCTPPEWEETTRSDYQNKRYLLYDVRVGDKEYETEVNAFVNGDNKVDVKSIKRVQNPYQLGRFVLRKEQKKFRGNNVDVVKYYHPLKSCDLEVALEHNMDVRRYNSKDYSQYSDKNPKFYKDPGNAVQQLQNCEIILICNVLCSSSISQSSVTYKGYDTEYMPTYVVKVV